MLLRGFVSFAEYVIHSEEKIRCLMGILASWALFSAGKQGLNEIWLAKSSDFYSRWITYSAKLTRRQNLGLGWVTYSPKLTKRFSRSAFHPWVNLPPAIRFASG